MASLCSPWQSVTFTRRQYPTWRGLHAVAPWRPTKGLCEACKCNGAAYFHNLYICLSHTDREPDFVGLLTFVSEFSWFSCFMLSRKDYVQKLINYFTRKLWRPGKCITSSKSYKRKTLNDGTSISFFSSLRIMFQSLSLRKKKKAN